VNARHESGWSPGAEPVVPPATAPPGWAGSGVSFFDPGLTTARDIALSSGVKASRDNIAAGRVYGGAGDNALALELSQLRDLAVPVGATSLALGTHFRETVTGIGRDVQAADSSAAVYETLAAQTEVRRQSVSGVSTDEELIALMRHQQAYVAATRIVSAVDEMTQALLGMV
jgi:flagellar hook-associated protein 1